MIKPSTLGQYSDSIWIIGVVHRPHSSTSEDTTIFMDKAVHIVKTSNRVILLPSIEFAMVQKTVIEPVLGYALRVEVKHPR